ncbi:hypothetical protein TPHA_0F02310 [Tetrapisispora phaffii CBS 4417]|uniref:RRM domain-containing protein n=1 Tax=Tetrapisispora phaffii (strain ATCC 24235 / CBS 4417 / NBRC 1672 / NRRL Y-8282 / UCD 70-5) TaxID=1071381 RepID=G8BUC6_TETPH|nr:hypothetical protein TPHA_0F02310 [Tetrapisispora phaffii CBS 4417]CCE63712.1 hypothetical protein TPHA_0F02310 [Tetrapisispora phaffii CBS 4417]
MSDVEKKDEGIVEEVNVDDSNVEVKSSEQKIKEALTDPTKKRKAEDEIEIDINKSIPLSKKQKRLLRRGKITLEDLNAKFNIDPSAIEAYKKEAEGKGTSSEINDAEGSKSEKEEKKAKKFGVWMGNMAFDTTKEDIIKYLVLKTKTLEGPSQITETDMVRFNMPLAKSDGKKIKNKGFCYIDFKTLEQMESAIALSETELNGRKLLIKSSTDYAGRPDKSDLVSMSKNPPSRILFVGNLSFDTTDELLRKHFQHCGDIVKIRMATFQDSGKCKGFAFVDFKNEEGATKALSDKSCRKIAGRPLRMEFGEDRSKRVVKRKEQPASKREAFDIPTQTRSEYSSSNTTSEAAPASATKKPFKKFNNRQHIDKNNRVKSSIALSSAQRGSVAIVQSTGKKTTF